MSTMNPNITEGSVTPEDFANQAPEGDPPTNCPAFPVDEEWNDGISRRQFRTGGMTLRDYYAAKALQGLCANPGGPFQANSASGWSMTNCSMQDIALLCHDLADAMLSQRQSRAK